MTNNKRKKNCLLFYFILFFLRKPVKIPWLKNGSPIFLKPQSACGFVFGYLISTN